MTKHEDIDHTGLTGVGSPTARGCRAVSTAGQSINNNTLTALAFAAADLYDSDAYHDPSSNNTRITIPAGLGGVYRIGAQATWQTSSGTGERLIALRVDGSTYIALDHKPAYTAPGEQYMSISTEYALTAGQYVEVIVRQVSTGSLSLNTNGTYGAQFYCSLIGA